MKIQNFSQLGKRSNNEDSFGVNDALITVCDGMGGHVSGERASSFVVKSMLEVFSSQQSIGKMDIQKQLDNVQLNMNELLESEPELEKMGTTFTGIFKTLDVWYAAHIGDSRIYLFRPSEEKLWHTWDHSLVGELMRTHEITCEGGRFHPMSNRISKAIIARKDGKPVSASIVKIDNLKVGDIFLLCSDGVVEGCSDVDLVNIFSDNENTFEQKCEAVRKLCSENSKDNNTAVMIEIESQDEFSYGSNDELSWTSFDEVFADYEKYVNESQDDGDGYSIEVEESPKSQTKPQPQINDSPVGSAGTPNMSAPVVKRSVSDSQSGSFPVGTRKKQKIMRLAVGIVAVLVVAVVVFFMMKKCSGKAGGESKEPVKKEQSVVENAKNNAKPATTANNKEESVKGDEETECFNKCTDLEGCTKYIENYPNGKFVTQVKDLINKLDEQTFKACKSIGDYDSYLKDFPDGKYKDQAKVKKGELEKQQRDANGQNEGQELEEPAKGDDVSNEGDIKDKDE